MVTVVCNVSPAWHQARGDAMMVFLMYSSFIQSYQMYLVLHYERAKLSLFEGVINPSQVPAGHNHLYFLEGPALRPIILDSAIMVLSAFVEFEDVRCRWLEDVPSIILTRAASLL